MILSEVRQGRLVEGDPLQTLDSVAKLEAILAIEAAFGVELPDAEWESVHSLADLEALLGARMGHSSAAPAETEGSLGPLPALPIATFGALGQRLAVVAARFWFRFRVDGPGRLPAGPCLLCANHTSHLDSIALLVAAGTQRDRLVFAAAKDYFFSHSRLARLSSRLLPMIPWERGGEVTAMRENLRQLAACREANRIVVFFPEGGRSSDGRLQPFKDGLGFFAGRVGLPVVPCWISGTLRALPKGASIPRPGRLVVKLGEVVASGTEGAALAATVRDRIIALGAAP